MSTTFPRAAGPPHEDKSEILKRGKMREREKEIEIEIEKGKENDEKERRVKLQGKLVSV